MAGMAVLNTTAMSNSPGSSSSSGEVCVVPIGWKREYVQGRIVYVSPSHSYLWSHEDVMSYLTTDGTCKCGLACPLFVDKVFNFDPACSLQHYANISDNNDTNQNHNLCNQHRKLQALAHYRSILKGNTDHGHQTHNPIHNHHQQHDQQQHQHQTLHHLQQQQLMRHQSPNGYDRRPSLQQQHTQQQQQLHIETRSPHVHTLIPNEHSNAHDASQQIVVNPSEVSGREIFTSYVNGNDTHVHHHQQQHHPHNPHHQHPAHHHQQQQHLSPSDSRQHLHDVTAVTASITELIPSVGQLMPQIPMAHHHPAHVQYSLILPQQILTMPADAAHGTQHMLLSPQIVSSFPNHTITSPYHQQHHYSHPQLMYDTQSNTSDLLKHRARQRNRSSKKVRTVAAILNLTT